MVGSARRRLATGAAAVVLAANLCAAMDPCTLCQEAVTQLVEGKVSGCGTPGTNADFEECSRIVQGLLVNAHSVTQLIWDGCTALDSEQGPKRVTPCPSHAICAAVLPGSCPADHRFNTLNGAAPGASSEVDAALHTFRTAEQAGVGTLLDPNPVSPLPEEPASALAGYPSPATASTLPPQVYRRYQRSGVLRPVQVKALRILNEAGRTPQLKRSRLGPTIAAALIRYLGPDDPTVRELFLNNGQVFLGPTADRQLKTPLMHWELDKVAMPPPQPNRQPQPRSQQDPASKLMPV